MVLIVMGQFLYETNKSPIRQYSAYTMRSFKIHLIRSNILNIPNDECFPAMHDHALLQIRVLNETS